MPRYKIKFTRTWTETDTYEQVIEADSPEDAQARGQSLANAFDSSCPDDVWSSKDGEAGSWGVDDIEETDEEVDDE